jgi:hypothetical protein
VYRLIRSHWLLLRQYLSCCTSKASKLSAKRLCVPVDSLPLALEEELNSEGGGDPRLYLEIAELVLVSNEHAP